MKIVANTEEVEEFAFTAYRGRFFSIGETGTLTIGERKTMLRCVEQNSWTRYWPTIDVLNASRVAADLPEHHLRRSSHLLPAEGLYEETIAQSLSAGGLKPYNRDGTRSITLQNMLACKPFRADQLMGNPQPAHRAAMIMEFRGLAVIHLESYRERGYPLWHTYGCLEWTGARILTAADREALEALVAEQNGGGQTSIGVS
jgi:hypothetical protein